MRLEDLKLFLTIADTLNLHRAAEREGLSQPTLTKALRRLEHELGVTLVERVSRGVVLTDIGKAFAVRINRMDLELEQAKQEIADMRLGKLGLVRFGSTVPMVDLVFTPAAVAFLHSRPKVRYELSVQHTIVLVDDLLAGKLDLVLAVVPRKIPPELDYEVLFRQRFHVVARCAHPLSGKSTIHSSDLISAIWQLPPPSGIVRQLVEERLAEEGLPPPIVAVETEATSVVLAALLRQSDLLSIMSREAIHSSLGTGLTVLDGAMGPWELPLALLWRRNAYLSPIVRDFRELIRREVESLAISRNM